MIVTMTEMCVPTENVAVVLCVDDDSRALMVRSLMLSIAGYDVQTATSVESALLIFQHVHVDVVILDDFYPTSAGAELADVMRRLKPEVLIVLCTAGSERDVASKADLTLIKGMEPPAFLAAIDRLLVTRRRAARAAAAAASGQN